MVHEHQDDGTSVLGSLHDLSSDHLVKRSKHPAGTLKAILDVFAHWAAEPIWVKCSARRSTA